MMGSSAQTSGSGLRRRNCGSKVKNGCESCKNSHLKCDKKKPICGRCTTAEKACRYPDAFRAVSLAEQRWHCDTSPSCQFSIAHQVDSVSCVPLDLHCRSLFHYFRQKTSLELSSLLPIGFWNEFVLPMSAYRPSIQYAIVALASQHRLYIEQKSAGAADSQFSNAQKIYSLQYYGRAITSLNERLEQPLSETETLKETLVACLLFICFNVLQGNDIGALTHLDSGLRIQTRYSQALAECRSRGNTSFQSIANLQSALSRMDLQAALYLGSYHIKSCTDDAEFGPFPKSTSSIRCLFQNIQEARAHLEKMVLSASHFMRSVAEPLKYLADTGGSDYQHALCHRDLHIQRLQSWFVSFDRLISSLPSSRGREQGNEVATCRISYAAKMILLCVCLDPDEMAYDLYLPLFQDIIASADAILDLPLDMPGPRPIFDIEMSVIHPLYFTAIKCRDPLVRDQAKELLSRCGKEGVWDGDIMTCVASHVIALEESERAFDPAKGKWDIPEEGRVCGTALNVIRDKKVVLVKCTARQSKVGPGTSMNAGVTYNDNYKEPGRLFGPHADYDWTFRESILKW